jgi:two-component system chemotaxis response regulator CheY
MVRVNSIFPCDGSPESKLMSTILVIDDTAFWRDLVSDALRRKGHTVVTAEDGFGGLEVLQKDGADLVIVDMEMPKMEGLEFLERVHQMPQWKDLPIIMLSGDMHIEQVVRARQLGATDYLIKTRFSLSDLLERVERRLAAQQAVSVIGGKPA